MSRIIDKIVSDFLIEDRGIPDPEPTPLSICTPFYNSHDFINTYLHHITLLDYPRDLISFYFTVQGKDDTIDTVKRFQKDFGSEYRKIKVKTVKQTTGGEQPHVRNVVLCRNLLSKWSNPDPVLFVDHDNFLPPFSVKRLQQGTLYGGDIVGGMYVFWQTKPEAPKEGDGLIGFPAFFNIDGVHHYTCVDRYGFMGGIDKRLRGNRLWVSATAMGCTLIQRKVLDKVNFVIPWGTTMTDDAAFCLEAEKHGFKIIADFGLLVKHWGFNMEILGDYKDKTFIRINPTINMSHRRHKMKVDGIYPV